MNWWSCIGKGLRLQLAQQACFSRSHFKKEYWKSFNNLSEIGLKSVILSVIISDIIITLEVQLNFQYGGGGLPFGSEKSK